MHMHTNPWTLDQGHIFSHYKTGEKGLLESQVDERRSTYGKNVIKTKRQRGPLQIFLSQFKSPLIFILIIAGIVTLFLREWIDACVIFLAIFVNAALGFYQESRAEKSLELLKSYVNDRARVIRDGVEIEIDARELVVGDLLHLSYGSRVPADARILSCKDFSVDESILTGESLTITKQSTSLPAATPLPERTNMVFSGTLITEGYATAIVTAVGEHTEFGSLASLVSETERAQTPLQKSVGRLARFIAIFFILFVIVIFALGVWRGESIVDMFVLSAAVAVGAIPEALPIALTVVLTIGVERIARRKGIMRNLSAAETLGSTTLIMTDKTGTLTEGNLQFLASRSYANAYSDVQMLRLASYNTDVFVEHRNRPLLEWNVTGKPLEVGVIRALIKQNDHTFLGEYVSSDAFRVILPFNSTNKFSVSVYEATSQKWIEGIDSSLVFVGAPDILLGKSSLQGKEKALIEKEIEALSSEGKRILGVGIHTLPSSLDPTKVRDIEGITFVGLLLFHDPVRESVPASIADMEKHYGIRVVMATGDLPGTALAVAHQLGWDVDASSVMTGKEVTLLSDEELLMRLPSIRVFARVTPQDKLRIGLLYKQQGEIVGMTGDGVNDAPSLKAVDIGIAVGSGSDVSKDVADLVLLDDNFTTIVSAIEEGKRVLANMKKSFVYLMSNSLDEVALIGLSLFAGLPLPLSALQIIWVNFFTGSIPSLSFAFDSIIDTQKNPKKTQGNILDGEVRFLVLGIGVLTSLLLFAIYWVLLDHGYDETIVRSFIFTCFSSYILFGAFSFRSLKKPLFSYNIFSNTLLNIGVGIGILLIIGSLYVPFLASLFGVVPLSLPWIGGVILWGIVSVFLIESAKWMYRNR